MHLPDGVNTVYHSLSEVCCFVVRQSGRNFHGKLIKDLESPTVKFLDCSPVDRCSVDNVIDTIILKIRLNFFIYTYITVLLI